MVQQTHDVAVEDVLDGDVPDIPVPRPRTRFTRRRDVLIGLLLVVALVAAAVLVWRGSGFRATSSSTADDLGSAPAGPQALPAALAEVWRAESAATPRPVVAGASVVTGQGGDVVGRDPFTGAAKWSYGRDLSLCTVGSAWADAVAVYRTDGGALPGSDSRASGGCSAVSVLDGGTGVLDATRDSDAEPGSLLVYGGSHLTATGPRLLTTWRSDLVETVEYGLVPTPVNPDRQPRPGCAHESTLASGESIAVVERCADEPADRLTVLKTVPEESDSPEVLTSRLLQSDQATLVAVTDRATAVALPDPERVVVFDDQGIEVRSYPMALGRTAQPRVPPTTTATGAFYWHTGTKTIALSTEDLHPLWTVEGTLGPATTLAGRALVPVPGGLAVIDQSDGTRLGTLPVDRAGYTGPVAVASIGPVVLEQRGGTLVALR